MCNVLANKPAFFVVGMIVNIKAQIEKKNAKHDFITLMLLKQIQMHVMEVYDSSRNNQFTNER